MQYTCVKNNVIENIIVCEHDFIKALDSQYDEFLEYKRHHEIGVHIVNGEFCKEIFNSEKDILLKFKYSTDTDRYEYDMPDIPIIDKNTGEQTGIKKFNEETLEYETAD